MVPLIIVLVITVATLFLALRAQTQARKTLDSIDLLIRLDLQEIREAQREIKRRTEAIERRLWT